MQYSNTTMGYATANLDEAARFLRRLDPAATMFEFRTFDDNKARKDPSLTRAFYGTLAQRAPELERLNKKGAGVFVVINETDGKGRETENITRARSLFTDLDGAPLETVRAAAIKPHMIVESSPGKWHPYWRVADMPLEDFTPTQEALIERFGGDPKVKALAHVMRLPGFFHRKGEPFLVRIIETHDAPPYPAKYFAKKPPRERVRRADDDVEVNPDKAIAALNAATNDDVEEDTWFKTMAAAFIAAGDDKREQERVYKAFVRWSERSGKHNEKRTRQRWRAFVRKPPRDIRPGTLYQHADDTAPSWRAAYRQAEQDAAHASIARGAARANSAEAANAADADDTAAAEPNAAKTEKPKQRVLDPADPIQSARALMAELYTDLDGRRKLHRHRGAFWSWVGSHFREADDEAIRSACWTFLEQSSRWERPKNGPPRLVPFKPNRARVGDAVDALSAVSQLDKYVDPPAWLTSSNMPPPNEFFACANGLLHLPTGDMYPPTPDYFNVSASDVVFDPDAPPPTQWLGFLDQVFEGDKEAKDLLQDWFGYDLSPDTSLQKILLMVGPKRSGKGTIARIKAALLGRASVCGPTMSSLSDTFGLEPLITKPLAIISDARIGARTDKSAIVERLLSISGEDTLSVPRKHKQAWEGTLPTRIAILTNELPSLSDGSGALAGRFVILIMTKSFFGKEDRALTNKLKTELAGILNWSIAGYRRLRQRGYLVQPQSSYQAADNIEVLAAPVKAFVRDCCEVGPGLEQRLDDLWNSWRLWSDDEGRPDAGSKNWFARNLQSAVPGLTAHRPKVGNEQVQVYVGIKLRSPPSGFTEHGLGVRRR